MVQQVVYTSLKKLRKLPKQLPTQEIGNQWVEIRHSELIELVVARANELGIEIEYQYELNPSNKEMLVYFFFPQIKIGINQEDTMVMTVLNNNNRTKALSVFFGVGHKVPDCPPIIFQGDRIPNKRHGVNMDLNEHVFSWFRYMQSKDLTKSFDEIFNRMFVAKISVEDAVKALMGTLKTCYRMNNKRIMKTQERFMKEKESKRTLLSLFTAFAHEIQNAPATRRVDWSFEFSAIVTALPQFQKQL